MKLIGICSFTSPSCPCGCHWKYCYCVSGHGEYYFHSVARQYFDGSTSRSTVQFEKLSLYIFNWSYKFKSLHLVVVGYSLKSVDSDLYIYIGKLRFIGVFFDQPGCRTILIKPQHFANLF